MVFNLIQYFQTNGLRITCAAHAGYESCEKEGRHEPDLKAISTNELISIGEAKTCQDLSSTVTKEQLRDYATRVMKGGKSDGQPVQFYLLVSKDCVGDAWKVLRELGLDARQNVHVLS